MLAWIVFISLIFQANNYQQKQQLVSYLQFVQEEWLFIPHNYNKNIHIFVYVTTDSSMSNHE